MALGIIGIGVVAAHNNGSPINAVKLSASKPSADNSAGQTKLRSPQTALTTNLQVRRSGKWATDNAPSYG